MAEFAIDFWVATQEVGRDEDALKGIFISLSEQIKEQLILRDEPVRLDELINLLIRVDNHLKDGLNRSPVPRGITFWHILVDPPTSACPVPHQLQRNNRNPCKLVTSISHLCFPAIIIVGQMKMPNAAFVNPGAEQNLISSDLVKSLQIRSQPFNHSISVTGISGQATSQVKFKVSDIHTHPNLWQSS